MAVKKNKPVVLNVHLAACMSAASLNAADSPLNSTTCAEVASRTGKPSSQVCVSGFLRRAAASFF